MRITNEINNFAMAPPVPSACPTAAALHWKGEDMAQTRLWRFGVVAMFAVLMTACAEDGASPLAPRTISGAQATADTVVTEFTVGPGGGRFNVGGTHRIAFPAAAICDLATSSYGPTTWNSPCLPSALPVRITAKTWTDGDGHPRVDFSPAMRFAP